MSDHSPQFAWLAEYVLQEVGHSLSRSSVLGQTCRAELGEVVGATGVVISYQSPALLSAGCLELRTEDWGLATEYFWHPATMCNCSN
jgi:hypothetical protein